MNVRRKIILMKERKEGIILRGNARSKRQENGPTAGE